MNEYPKVFVINDGTRPIEFLVLLDASGLGFRDRFWGGEDDPFFFSTFALHPEIMGWKQIYP